MKIIIPFRNRPQHLAAWQSIPNTLFIEQAEGKPWNREILFNIAVLETKEDYYIFNDVDMVPEKPFIPYTGVTQLAVSKVQIYDYLGGSTMYDRQTIIRVGGFSNDFWGGRGGDNEMKANLNRLRVNVRVKLHPFTEQAHPRPDIEFDPVMWKKAHQPRKVQNQLADCRYKVLERKEGWIKVEI